MGELPESKSAKPVKGRDAEPHSLAQARTGSFVRVRELRAPADIAGRLRELGFCEQQRIRLLSSHTNIICQVCNVRLGISRHLAGMIVVEPAGSGAEQDGGQRDG